MDYAHDHGLFTFCPKCNETVSFLVCHIRGCVSLREEDGKLYCKIERALEEAKRGKTISLIDNVAVEIKSARRKKATKKLEDSE